MIHVMSLRRLTRVLSTALFSTALAAALSTALSTAPLITPHQVNAQEIFELGSLDRSTRQPERDALPARWPTLPLLEKYRGEERRGVRYFTEAERAQAKLRIKNGALCDLSGALLNPSTSSAQAEQRATETE